MNIILATAVVSSLVMGGQGLTLDSARPVSTPAVEVVDMTPDAPVDPVTPTVKEDAGGGGSLQFVAQAWDNTILTWQYKTIPCADVNGCVDISSTSYWKALKALYPQIYK